MRYVPYYQSPPGPPVAFTNPRYHYPYSLSPFFSFMTTEPGEGFVCPAGSTSPMQCLDGQRCPPGSQEFIPCEAGNYCVKGWQYKCTSIAGQATFCPQGSSEAAICREGYYCSSPLSEILCPITNSTLQFYCSQGSSNPGSYCPDSWECPTPQEKQRCHPGYYCASGAANPCPLGSYSNVTGASVIEECKPCKSDRSTVGVGSTSELECLCKSGYYTDLNGDCKLCQDGIVCDKLSTSLTEVTVEEGFYPIIDDGTIHSMKCLSKAACNGSACNPGYEGFLCATCSINYQSPNSIQSTPLCLSCDETFSTNMIQLGIAFVVGILLLAILIKMKFVKSRNIMKNESTSSNISVIQRVFLSHLQVIGIIGGFNFQWPDSIKSTFQVFRTIASLSFVSDGVGGGIKCALYLQTLPNPMNDLMINVVLLLIALLLIQLFWRLLSCIRSFTIKKKEGEEGAAVDLLSTTQKIIISYIALLYLVYSNFVRLWFQLFSCTQFRDVENIPIESEKRLNGALDMICYQSGHVNWLLMLGLPVGIFIILGVPLLAFLKLSRNRRSGSSMEGTYTKATYGFLMDGYAKSYWFWEIVILARYVIVPPCDSLSRLVSRL
jgi:hypothetical protein